MSKRPSTASNSPKPIYVIYGSDRFLMDEAANRVRHCTIGVQADPLACSELDADTELAEVFDELRTLPLLAPYRLVIIREADPFVSRHRMALEHYCSSASPSASLLLISKSFDARTRLYKAVGSVGEIIKCEPPRGTAATSWLTRRAQDAYQKRLDYRAAELLRRQVGDDLATMDSELQKLSTYVGQRSVITADDIEKLVGLHREEKVFGIADALAERDAAKALNLWEQVWQTDRAAPGRAIAGLAWALRRDLQAKSEIEQGAPYERLAKKFWMSPAELKGRLEKMPLQDFEDQLGELLQADVGVKTGLNNVLAAVEKLIIQRCAMAEGAAGSL